LEITGPKKKKKRRKNKKKKDTKKQEEGEEQMNEERDKSYSPPKVEKQECADINSDQELR